MDAFVAVEGEDDFAVAARLESVLPLVALADVAVVVYFAIDGQHLPAVG